jgi:predicted ATPase
MPGIAERYAGLAESGALERDPAQARTVDRLQRLQDELSTYRRADFISGAMSAAARPC